MKESSIEGFKHLMVWRNQQTRGKPDSRGVALLEGIFPVFPALLYLYICIIYIFRKMDTSVTYSEFEYNPDELTKYTEAAGIFSIILSDGKIIHHKPANPNAFREWLNKNDILNIRNW